MHLSLLPLVLLPALTTSVAAWAPRSTLEARANSTFLNCLEDEGLDPVVQDEAAYASSATAYNQRYVLAPVPIHGCISGC